MLPFAVAGQSMQAIAGRHCQIGEIGGSVDPLQPAVSALLVVGRQLPASLAIPDFLGFAVLEAANHGAVLSP
jgi:hypothetical protein